MPAANTRRPAAANRFPDWLRRSWGSGHDFAQTREVLQGLALHTVCQSARCPNMGECWSRRTATFLILGNVCTRKCGFCAVTTGTPGAVDASEPARIAEAVARLDIRHAVVTSVTRDDLPDGGAAHFADTVRAIRRRPGVAAEVLVPDFAGRAENVRTVIDAAPKVFGHNIETVRRLYPALRDRRAGYDRSLQVLAAAAAAAPSGMVVKSALMLGLGETEDEVGETLDDLHAAGCRAVAIGQYLRPSKSEVAVVDYIRPEQFKIFEDRARAIGFTRAVAGPFVRSSYHADAMTGVQDPAGPETAPAE